MLDSVTNTVVNERIGTNGKKAVMNPQLAKIMAECTDDVCVACAFIESVQATVIKPAQPAVAS